MMTWKVLCLPFPLPTSVQEYFELEPIEFTPSEYRYLVPVPAVLVPVKEPAVPVPTVPLPHRELYFHFHACLDLLPPASLAIFYHPQFSILEDTGQVQLNLLDSLPSLLGKGDPPEILPFECHPGTPEEYFQHFDLYWRFYPSQRHTLPTQVSPQHISDIARDTWPRFFLAQDMLRYLSQQLPNIPLQFTQYLLKCIHPIVAHRPSLRL
jgi:hypothetical protein